MNRTLWPVLGALALLASLVTSASAQSTPSAPPRLPSDITISPGDVIAITVIGEPTLSRSVTVSSEGTVPVAFAGELKVSGMKPAEAAAAIKKALSRYLRDPAVTVDLLEANRASVYGRVVKPGTYVLPPQARAIDLIQMAGGFEAGADRGSVRLLRKGATIGVDLDKFANTGDPQFNPPLEAGDMLNVPERRVLTIQVLGQVAKPGNVTMPLESRIMEAVQMAGGFTERADREKVAILRDGTQIPVNLARFADQGLPTDNPTLQTNDSVMVPEKRMLSVSVLGQVLKPSVYQLPEGSTVAEAVAMAGGIATGADLSLARLIRRDQQNTAIPLREALENGNAAANIKLLDGDTISLPKPEVARRFGVLGAVRAGGYFEMERDRVAITEALSRAGGPEANADLGKGVIVRRNGDQTLRSHVDLRKILQANASADMVTLGPGDVLYLEVKKKPFINQDNMWTFIGLIPALIYALGG